MGQTKKEAVMADDPKPEPDKDPDPKPDPPQSTPDDVRAMKAALTKANKEAADLRTKFKEIEDRDKSDSEKLTAKVADAERKLFEAEAKTLRLEVAASKGLSPTQAKRLVGATQEELEADADELLDTFGTKSPTKDDPKPNVSRRPNPALNGGGDPTIEAEETDPIKLAAEIRGGM